MGGVTTACGFLSNKTLLNVNAQQKLRGKWSLDNAKILLVPDEWMATAEEHQDHGFMIECFEGII